MEFGDVIYGRRSIRVYKDKEVEDEKINTLLKYAMAAPSAMNKKPVEFIVVKNKEIIKQLTTYNPPLLIIVLVDNEKTITKDRDDFYNQDASAAVEHILLGAYNLGLGSVWLGTYPIKERMDQVSKILNLKENILPFAKICIGYADEEKPSRTQFEESRVKEIK